MKHLALCLGIAFSLFSIAKMKGEQPFDRNALYAELSQFVADKPARIGIAVITPAGDTIAINGNQAFPMLSVYKFPQALAVADYCIAHHISFADTIDIAASEIHPDTYSPLREAYGIKDLRLPISELLAYSMQASDNNACDILFRFINGTATADSLMQQWGFPDIHIQSTEAAMHEDVMLCYENAATPLEMTKLLSFFYYEWRNQSPEYQYIANLMENCATGTDRLAAPLSVPSDTIGHKTGTGDTNAEGNIIGINDVGYIRLSNGKTYFISVFISDSSDDMAGTAHIIADISQLVLKHLF